jgi:2-keto-4-pentenoate hydratase/2-oxohepta-3-ene-1,7-dioic acid hydratase in catechol pathway
MKLISYVHGGRPGWGEVRDDGGVAELWLAPSFDGVATLAQALDRYSLEDLLQLAAPVPASLALADLQLLPVIPRPGKILCVGLNYRAHVLETGREPPEFPLLFTRFAESQVGHGTPLVRPRASTRFDYEGELAVVIGRSARHVDRSRALDHVAGFACFNDGSIRDWQRHSSHFTAGKNFVGSGAFGPWLVTRDEIPDPAALHLRTRVNGVEVQSAPVSDLVFDVPTLIEYVTTFTRLEPGDVLVTGTPSGVGAYREPRLWLHAGDVVEVEIDGVGVLRNAVIDEPA